MPVQITSQLLLSRAVLEGPKESLIRITHWKNKGFVIVLCFWKMPFLPTSLFADYKEMLICILREMVEIGADELVGSESKGYQRMEGLT